MDDYVRYLQGYCCDSSIVQSFICNVPGLLNHNVQCVSVGRI